MEFHEWMTDKFIQWRGTRYGKGSSVAEFAKLFGATQQLMSQWMLKGGPVPKHKKYIDALVDVYGEEVYGVLNIPKPKNVRERPTTPWDQLPAELRDRLPDFRARLASAILETNETLAERGIEAASDEALEIAIEIFSKYGINLKKVPNSG